MLSGDTLADKKELIIQNLETTWVTLSIRKQDVEKHKVLTNKCSFKHSCCSTTSMMFALIRLPSCCLCSSGFITVEMNWLSVLRQSD